MNDEPLSFSYEPPPADVLTVEGVRYSGEFFRLFADPDSTALYSIKRNDDGVLVVTKIEKQAST